MIGLFGSGTYPVDRPLFERLGLEPFSHPSRGWHDCGTYETDRASVKVEVSCMPAQFWRFTITSKIEDVQDGVLSTGSGTLAQYWPSVEHWINGCLQYEES